MKLFKVFSTYSMRNNAKLTVILSILGTLKASETDKINKEKERVTYKADAEFLLGKGERNYNIRCLS